MPGASCTRSLVCEINEHTSVVTTGSDRLARHSPRNGFNGFLRALPGDEFPFVTVALRMLLAVCARLGRLRLRKA